MKALITGGGIGGLAVAVALRNQGIEADVYEKTSAFREIGSAVVLSPNGVKALDKLGRGIGEHVRAQGQANDPKGTYSFLTQKGKTISAMSFGDLTANYGAPMITIERHVLHRILYEALGDEGLFTGAQLTSYAQDEQGVIARFADGSRTEGDLLIGADGLHSVVRGQMFGTQPPDYMGATSIRGIVAGLEHPHAHGGFLTMGRGVQVFTSPLSGGRLYWAVTTKSTPGVWQAKDRATLRRDLLDLLQGFHAPVDEMIRRSADETLVVTDLYDRQPLPTWSQGRVTLLGDSAHPMSPYMGQGVNMALEDAIKLATELPQHGLANIPEAFITYESARLTRTAQIMKQSRQLAKMGAIDNRLICALRDVLMPLLMKNADPDKQNRELFSYTP